MESGTEHIDQLIAKYLAGEADASEKQHLEIWMAQEIGNREYFNGLKLVFEKVDPVKEWHSFNTDAAWDRMKLRLNTNSGTIPLSRQPNKWFYLRIAASILFFMSVGMLLYQWNNTRPGDKLQVAANETTIEQELPDGSTAFLNKGSSVTYAFYPSGNTRKVVLEGEAFFEVDHMADKPFVIESRDVMIKDLGTAFNVRSYPDESVVEVLVLSGEVAFYTEQDKGIQLKAGERGLYDRRTKSFSWFSGIDANAIAYKTRTFSFDNTDLGSVVESLNQVYPKHIVLDNEQLKNCRLNVSFKGEDIEAIADIIAETLGLTMIPEADHIRLEGEGCGD